MHGTNRQDFAQDNQSHRWQFGGYFFFQPVNLPARGGQAVQTSGAPPGPPDAFSCSRYPLN